MVSLKRLFSESEYRAALREASAFFENEPEPGTPEGDRFEALLEIVEAFEAEHCAIGSAKGLVQVPAAPVTLAEMDAAIAAQGAKANCPSIRAVVFDVFGTLAEIGERRRPYLRLMKLAAAAGRKPQPDDAAKIMSTDADIFGIADSLGLKLSAEMRAEIEQDLAIELASISLFPEVPATLEALRRQGVKIGLCSNLAKPYAAPVLALLPFELDAYAWSFEVGAIKPDPAIYRSVCDRLDLPPEQILFVGDTYAADCEGPREYGMRAIQLTRGGIGLDVKSIQSLELAEFFRAY